MKEFLFVSVLFSCVLGVPIAQAQHTLRDSSRLYLLLNGDRIASTDGVTLMPGKPVKFDGNPIMVEDKPWEPRYDNLYPNVTFDPFEKFYKGWFSPFVVCESTSQTPMNERSSRSYMGDHAGTKREAALVYGTSHDGKLWNKPLLDLHPWGGDQKTNILLRRAQGAGVIRDAQDSARQYKMLSIGDEGLQMHTSRDGIRWGQGLPAVGAETSGDTHQFLFWAPELREYVAMTRVWAGDGENRERAIGRTSSKDFRSWTPVRQVLKGIEPDLQIYTLPVLRHGGVYIGFPSIYDRKSDRVRTELAWSPDTIQWERIAPGVPFLANGDEGSVDWGCAIAGSVIPMNDGIRIFYSGGDGKHSSWRNGSLNLALLDSDRIAGYQAGTERPGAVVLKPMVYSGGNLVITADVNPGGYVIASAEDADGNNIVKSVRIEESGTDIPIESAIPEGTKQLSLRFRLQDATLYSFGFR